MRCFTHRIDQDCADRRCNGWKWIEFSRTCHVCGNANDTPGHPRELSRTLLACYYNRPACPRKCRQGVRKNVTLANSSQLSCKEGIESSSLSKGKPCYFPFSYITMLFIVVIHLLLYFFFSSPSSLSSYSSSSCSSSCRRIVMVARLLRGGV